MGGCASKSVAVGSERQNSVPSDSAASLTCKPQSGVSGVATSTGSQLRSAAKTAWQTSARSLRMSLSKSRRRQESYRLHSNGTGSDVEQDEIDSAGNGGRPENRRRSITGGTPTAVAGAAAPAVANGVAWEPSVEMDPQSGQRTRYLTDTARGEAAGVDADAGEGESCVQSFHVGHQVTGSLDEEDASTAEPDCPSAADAAGRRTAAARGTANDGNGSVAGGVAGRRPRASVGDGGWTIPDATAVAAAPAGPTVAAGGSPSSASQAAAAAGAGGGAAATATDAAAASSESVQWVIRPGPPVESVYALGEVLGKGSFGVVRGATHLVTGAQVAVKTIRKSLLAATDVSSLRREVEILHHLSGHPHISQLLGVFEEPAQLHLVLELYKGGDLFDAIIAVGRHSERAAADVMRTVLMAIAYCHAMGVAHRDIKPENFMLTAPPHPAGQGTGEDSEYGEENNSFGAMGGRLKLIDFGLSVFSTDSAPMTETVGTSYYVAPEVLAKSYSRSADVWSAGVILHILLTGYAPFDGKNDQEILRAVQVGKLDVTTDPIWTSISREATSVLTAMLTRDPVNRASAEQLLAMPWLGRTAAACTAPTAPLPGVVSERMRRFARMNSFKKEARRVVAGLMLEEEVAGLVAQFKSLDADGDGKLNVRELREGLARQEQHTNGTDAVSALKEDELREMVDRADLDGDGLLDQSEFLGAALPTSVIARQALAAASASSPGRTGSRGVNPAAAAAVSKNPLAAAFAKFDADGSGFITPDELRSALAAHHPSGQGPDIRALLSRVDKDADGRISYGEFVAMMVQEVDDDVDDMYGMDDMYGKGRGGGGHRLSAPGGGVKGQVLRPPGCRDDGAAGPSVQGGRISQGGVQRLRGANAVGGSPSDRSPEQCARKGKGQQHHHRQGQHHDEDTVPYEQLPSDNRNGRGRGGAKRNAQAPGAWGVGYGSSPVKPRNVPALNGQSAATSFLSTAAQQSTSGHISSFDWYDECNSREERADVGEDDVGWEHDEAVCTTTNAAANSAANTYGGGQPAGRGGGGYVPSRLAPQGAAAAPAATTGLYRAAEAAAMTLMGGGKNCPSLLCHLNEEASARSAVGGGGKDGAVGFLPVRPPALIVPQPAANQRARRHSAADALEDGFPAAAGEGGPDGDGRFGIMTERVVRPVRVSEGPPPAPHRNHHQPANGMRNHAAVSAVQKPAGHHHNLRAAGVAGRGGVAGAQHYQHPPGERSRHRQVQQLMQYSSDGSPSPGSSPSATAAAAHAAHGNAFFSPGASPSGLRTAQLRAELTTNSATNGSQHCRGRTSTSGGEAPPTDQLVSPAADLAGGGRHSGSSPLGGQQPLTPRSPMGPLQAASHPTVDPTGSPAAATRRGYPNRHSVDAVNPRTQQGADMAGGGGMAGGGRQADAVQHFSVLPPGACADDVISHQPSSRQRREPDSSGWGPSQGTAAYAVSEPLPAIGQRGQQQRPSGAGAWSDNGLRAGGNKGATDHMVLKSMLPSWEEEPLELSY